MKRMKPFGVGLIHLYRIVVLLAALVVPLRAVLLALHGAGDQSSTACSRAAGWAPSASRAVIPGIRGATTLSAEQRGRTIRLAFWPSLR